MTTHIVEIRRNTTHNELTRAGEWFALTREPITKRDAEQLAGMIHREFWEARIVALESPAGREFAELERRLDGSVRRWIRIKLNHHPDCREIAGTWSTREFGRPDDVFFGAEWVKREALRRVVASFTRADLDALGVRSIEVDGCPIIHQGHCQTCGAIARGLSAKVTIKKPSENGRELVEITREYAL